MKFFVADGEAGLMAGSGGSFHRIGPPGEALCRMGERIFCAGGQECRCYRDGEEEVFRLSLPTGVCALSTFGGDVCALSQDADCICAFCPRTGMMHMSVPAGVYPQDICPSPCGKYLAAAGGAAGEMMVFDGDFNCVQHLRTPGVCCGVCFLPRGMIVLCAVGDGELQTAVLRISPRGVTEEMGILPDAPCGLCPLPGGGWAAGCHGQTALFRRDGSIFRRIASPWPVRMRMIRNSMLICDGWQGTVGAPGAGPVYRGERPMDVLAIP